MEEINTNDVAQKISSELKRYSILPTIDSDWTPETSLYKEWFLR
jgi:hypothetical protein